ncbi:MAG TPA: lipopolysaccharide heptosyltransferase II, partial [Piscirickettsiaceae bacterium]|nr:lipopolysaccharide heptosyltransferase II [Piscirickettsiaceae bacterium]
DKNKYQNRHQVEKYNDFVNDSLSIDSTARKLQIYGYNIAKSKKKILGINPGASYGSAKRWYPQEFAKVASELSAEYDIVIFGGPSEIDIAGDIEQALIDSSVKNYKNLAGNTTITELINKISSLDLFITGDSGPMHIAAAFQIPTVAIFGPTKDKETSQWMNKKSIIVKKNLNCQPCMKRTCPLQHHDCMNLIKAIDVLKAVNSIN